MFSMMPILMHSMFVPPAARAALNAAASADEAQRPEMLRSAAHILHRETGLECSDVKALVGLPDGG